MTSPRYRWPPRDRWLYAGCWFLIIGGVALMLWGASQ